ncbi:hypothetical protein IFO70_08305 [Phormidium tenue FACHB-886]|nr:hypothetical protein [Phormidium tenue FACHB-886]
MTHEPIRPLIAPFQAQAELELLQLILQDSASCYPCNPAEPEAEAYFAALEQEVVKAGWSEEDFAAPVQVLATQLSQLWAAADARETVAQRLFKTEFFQRFAAQVPQQMLNTIVQRAQQMLSSNLTLADQLVHAVQECLPSWEEEDLQVLARPFAYAMRGSETEMLEVALRSVRCAEWAELSGVEQARLSLAIARYTIDQLPQQEG